MKSILVCTDGSAYAEVCCRYAAWLARRTGVQLEVIYVSNVWEYDMPFIMDLGGSMGASPYAGMIANLQEMEKHKAEILKEAVGNILEKEAPGHRFNFHHRTGSLVDCLNEFEGTENDVDLIMLGKRGENSRTASGHLGVTMERVVRASKKPVMVTNREFREIRKIVFAWDGGQSGTKALHWLAESDAVGGLELHVVTVGEGQGKGQASKTILQAEEVLKKAGRPANCQVLTGVVEDTIAKYVEDINADLLVMGAYGHSRIRHLLIGSTTTDLIRRCRIPVLLFR